MALRLTSQAIRATLPTTRTSPLALLSPTRRHLLFAATLLAHNRSFVSMTAHAATKWWDADTAAVVTGANKGIGYEIAKAFAKNGLKTVVTARKEDLGRAATQKIQEDTGSQNVLFHSLDIGSKESVEDFAKWAESSLGSITILVNNAGFAYKGSAFGPDEAQQTLDVNLYGTMAVCERLKPLMVPKTGRIVNVTSSAGRLARIPGDPLRRRFETAKTKEEVTELAEKFVRDVREGRHREEGWQNSMYGVSKACEAIYTRVLAQELEPRGIAVNAVHPGYVATDMSSWGGHLTAEEGADTPVWLALLPPGKTPTGGFFQERRQEPF